MSIRIENAKPEQNLNVVRSTFKLSKVDSIETVAVKDKLVFDLKIDDPSVSNYASASTFCLNGGGRRKGSIAMYLEPWHGDVFDFLDIRKNNGKEEMRARDLFTALWIPDIFMERVEADGNWTLFSPDEVPGLVDLYGEAFSTAYEAFEAGGLGKTIRARDLWNKIIESQIETGTPYMLSKCASNRKSNQKNLGTIRNSNLCCMTGDQRVVTSEGIKTVLELYNEGNPNIVLGRSGPVEASEMLLPRPNAPIVKIVTKQGFTHKVTPDHKVWVHNVGWVEAQNLKSGDMLEIQQVPGMWGKTHMPDEAFAAGKDRGSFAVPDFVWNGDRETVSAYLRGLHSISGALQSVICFDELQAQSIQMLLVNFGAITKISSSDGAWQITPVSKQSAIMILEIYNVNVAHHFSDIYGTDDTHTVEFSHLEELPNEDAYCLQVYTDEHSWTVNGMITKNTEIIQYSSVTETACCNLASFALVKFILNGTFDHNKLYEVVYQVTKNMNEVIDLNYYPTPETRFSNMRHRPIGLGVQGLADLFAVLKLPFDSAEAKKLNREIFETIYFAALSASKDLAATHGSYETFAGSPASQGILQYDAWGMSEADLSGRWDFAALKADIVRVGLRNSLLVAPMPTASTSQILGNNECFEPFTSNMYLRKTLSGEFPMINKHLVRDLEALDLWKPEIINKIIMADGSIQNVPEIPADIKLLYRTVWEIKQKDLIDMAADRGAFICQSQSMNLFIPDVNAAKLTSALFYAWRKGLKTLSYYIRTKAAASAIKGLGVESTATIVPKEAVMEIEQDVSCSLDNPEDCLACGS